MFIQTFLKVKLHVGQGSELQNICSSDWNAPVQLDIKKLIICWCQIPIPKKVNLSVGSVFLCKPRVIVHTRVKISRLAIATRIIELWTKEMFLYVRMKMNIIPWSLCARNVAAKDGNATNLRRKSWFWSTIKTENKMVCAVFLYKPVLKLVHIQYIKKSIILDLVLKTKYRNMALYQKNVIDVWPGKWKQLLRDPCGDGLGGGVALTLGGLLCWRCAGDEGAEEVADDGLLLESSWLEERLHSG